jgi:hypothetical protein
MEIIDILSPKYSECPEFEVDTGVDQVEVPQQFGILRTFGKTGIDSRSVFQERDNIRLLTAGFYIAESFTLANTDRSDEGRSYPDIADSFFPTSFMQLDVYNTAVAFVNYLPGLGSSVIGRFALPFPNYETALDLYCDIANLAPCVLPPGAAIVGDKFKIACTLYCNDISMIGVPAALNGKTIKVVPFVKILHTLPMIVS